MTGASTATVETLTAEVRVLMVGNRQITLSVAKQLDVIPLSRLRPFGRVKLGTGTPSVIGADAETGALSLSESRYEVNRRAYITLTTRPELRKPLRCRRKQPVDHLGHNDVAPGEVALAFGPNDWPIALNAEDMEDRHDADAQFCYLTGCDRGSKCTGYHCTEECKFWYARDYHDDIARQVEHHVAMFHEDRCRVKAAEELPLIVLAGLR